MTKISKVDLKDKQGKGIKGKETTLKSKKLINRNIKGKSQERVSKLIRNFVNTLLVNFENRFRS